MSNPFKDGLPALKSYNGPTGEGRVLFLGIEAATKRLRWGSRVEPEDLRFYQALIQRVEGLKAAMEHRIDMQGGTDDRDS